jgi:hypothetical protein
MSASAYGQVLYGYWRDSELLRVENGKKHECSRFAQHEVVQGKPYCPTCGGLIEEVPNMEYSEVLWDYACKHSLSADEAYAKFSRYERKAPRKYPDYAQNWVFGVLIAESGTNTCKAFSLLDLEVVHNLFKELGFDPEKAQYHLMVELT